MIAMFKGPNEFLSNFYTPVIIIHENVEYGSSEHLYNALKTNSQFFRRIIAAQPTPGRSKKFGRLVQLQPGWDDRLRIPAMQFVLRTKFSDPVLAEMLLNTGTQELIEGNWWHDNFWGDCNCTKCKNKKGLNNLGKVLMEIRADIPFGLSNLHKQEYILPEFYLERGALT